MKKHAKSPSNSSTAKPLFAHTFPPCQKKSSHQLDNTPSLLNLPFGPATDEARPYHDRDLRQPTFAENFGVSEREQVENGRRIAVLVGQVLIALLERDERPELFIWCLEKLARFLFW